MAQVADAVEACLPPPELAAEESESPPPTPNEPGGRWSDPYVSPTRMHASSCPASTPRPSSGPSSHSDLADLDGLDASESEAARAETRVRSETPGAASYYLQLTAAHEPEVRWGWG